MRHRTTPAFALAAAGALWLFAAPLPSAQAPSAEGTSQVYVETTSGCPPDGGTCLVVDTEPASVTVGDVYRTFSVPGPVAPGSMVITHRGPGLPDHVSPERDWQRQTFDERTNGRLPLDYATGRFNDQTRSFATLPDGYTEAVVTYDRVTSDRRREIVGRSGDVPSPPNAFSVADFGAVPLDVALQDPATAAAYALASAPTDAGARAALALLYTDADAQRPFSLALEAARRRAVGGEGTSPTADSVFVDVPAAYGVSGVLYVHDGVYLRGTGDAYAPTNDRGTVLVNLHGGRDAAPRGAVRYLPGASLLHRRLTWPADDSDPAYPAALLWQGGAQHVLTDCRTACGVLSLEIDGQVDLQPTALRRVGVRDEAVQWWYQNAPRHGGIASGHLDMYDRGRVAVEDVWIHHVGSNSMLGNSAHVWYAKRVVAGHNTDNHFGYGVQTDPRDPARDLVWYSSWWGSASDFYAGHVSGLTVRDVECNARRDQPGVLGTRGRADGDTEAHYQRAVWLVDSLSAAGAWDFGRGSVYRDLYVDARPLIDCRSSAKEMVGGPIWRGRVTRAVYLPPAFSRTQVHVWGGTQTDDFSADSVLVYATNGTYWTGDPQATLTDRSPRSVPAPEVVVVDGRGPDAPPPPATLAEAWPLGNVPEPEPVPDPDPEPTPDPEPVPDPGRYQTETRTTTYCRDTELGRFVPRSFCALD